MMISVAFMTFGRFGLRLDVSLEIIDEQPDIADNNAEDVPL